MDKKRSFEEEFGSIFRMGEEFSLELLLKISEKDMDEEMMTQMTEIKEAMRKMVPASLPVTTLVNELALKEMETLHVYAQDFGLSPESYPQKENLIEELARYILKPETVLEAIQVCGDGRFVQGRNDSDEPVAIPDCIFSFLRRGLMHIRIQEDGPGGITIVISEDVKALMQTLYDNGRLGDAIHCKTIDLMAQVCSNLYGIMPLKDFYSHYLHMTKNSIPRNQFNRYLQDHLNTVENKLYDIYEGDLLHSFIAQFIEEKEFTDIFHYFRNEFLAHTRTVPSIENYFDYVLPLARIEPEYLQELFEFAVDNLRIDEDTLHEIEEIIIIHLSLAMDLTNVNMLCDKIHAALPKTISRKKKKDLYRIVESIVYFSKTWLYQGLSSVDNTIKR